MVGSIIEFTLGELAGAVWSRDGSWQLRYLLFRAETGSEFELCQTQAAAAVLAELHNHTDHARLTTSPGRPPLWVVWFVQVVEVLNMGISAYREGEQAVEMLELWGEVEDKHRTSCGSGRTSQKNNTSAKKAQREG